ncbi:MAG: RNA-binding protein, partial [Oscillospiraceae bacterium]|nr:RNA-binding protein [Oscillospiraceae bacterium]
PTHRDFLGSILGQGIEREKVGDILVGDGVCDILVMRELCPYLLQNFDSAGRTRLRLEEISPEMLEPPEKKVKVIRDTVSSLRLDSVMATGFSLSRGKAADIISAGRVEVNHTLCQKSDRIVAQGDVLTCRGMGKCVLTEVSGLSKKGRTIITMERYL